MRQERVPFSVTTRIHSFGHALRGLRFLLQSQPNAWIHLLATVCIIAAGVFVRLAGFEWCLILLAMTVVWVTESFNTAVECLVDLVSPEIQPLAGRAKDVAAGAVLLGAIGASLVGVFVFLPHVLSLLSYSA